MYDNKQITLTSWQLIRWRHYRNISAKKSQNICFNWSECWNQCSTPTCTVYHVKNSCLPVKLYPSLFYVKCRVQQTLSWAELFDGGISSGMMLLLIFFQLNTFLTRTGLKPSLPPQPWETSLQLWTVSFPHQKWYNCAVSQMLRFSRVTSHENNYFT